MSVADNKELVRRITEEGMNKGDVSFVDAFFTPDYQVHTAGLELPRGPEAFKKAVALWRVAFPDFTVNIDEMVGEGDLVTNRFHTTGTHTGPLFGIPATGRTFEVHGVDMHRIENGRVAESWISDDVPRILTEIGIVPSGLPAGGPPAGAPTGAPSAA